MRIASFVFLSLVASTADAAESFVSKTPLPSPSDPLPYLVTINDPIGAAIPQSQLPAFLVPGHVLPVGMWGEKPFVKSCVTQPPLAPDQALTKGTFNDKSKVDALLPTLTASERQQVFTALKPLLEAGAQVEVKFPKATEPTCEMGSVNEGTLVTLTRNRLKPEKITVNLRISRILEMASVSVPGTSREVQQPKVAFREITQVLEIKPGGRQSLIYPSINKPGEQAEVIIEQKSVMVPMGKGAPKEKAAAKPDVPAAKDKAVPAPLSPVSAPAPLPKDKALPHASAVSPASTLPAKVPVPGPGQKPGSAASTLPPAFTPATKPIPIR